MFLSLYIRLTTVTTTATTITHIHSIHTDTHCYTLRVIVFPVSHHA